MSTTVYVVGDSKSPETNQWLYMTNSQEEAERLMGEVGEGATSKAVVVKPRPIYRGKKK